MIGLFHHPCMARVVTTNTHAKSHTDRYRGSRCTHRKAIIMKSPRSSRGLSKRLVVAVNAFHAFVALLCLDRHGGDGARFEPLYPNGFVGFLTIAVSAELDSVECLVDLRDQLAGSVPGAKFQGPVGLNAGPVGNIGLENPAFGKACEGSISFAEKISTPAEEFLTEIFQLD